MANAAAAIESQRKSTAYHEAGHGVCMLSMLYPPDSATIVPGDGYRGMVQRGLTKMTAGEMAAISMAGIVAQAEYLKRAGLPCDAETLAASGSKDLADVQEVLRAKALDCRLDMFLEIAMARAMRIIDDEWGAVERLAAELLAHGTLTGAQIEAAYRYEEHADAA
jgi:ATP-dependent Zn protease